MGTKIKISEILEIERRKQEINHLDLSEIDFIDDLGNVIDIPKNRIEEFKFIGLNNIDFITTGFYQLEAEAEV